MTRPAPDARVTLTRTYTGTYVHGWTDQQSDYIQLDEPIRWGMTLEIEPGDVVAPVDAAPAVTISGAVYAELVEATKASRRMREALQAITTSSEDFETRRVALDALDEADR